MIYAHETLRLSVLRCPLLAHLRRPKITGGVPKAVVPTTPNYRSDRGRQLTVCCWKHSPADLPFSLLNANFATLWAEAVVPVTLFVAIKIRERLHQHGSGDLISHSIHFC